jgi:hypothetical protein
MLVILVHLFVLHYGKDMTLLHILVKILKLKSVLMIKNHGDVSIINVLEMVQDALHVMKILNNVY